MREKERGERRRKGSEQRVRADQVEQNRLERLLRGESERRDKRGREKETRKRQTSRSEKNKGKHRPER